MAIRRGDHDYFAAIWREMDEGGYGAMLHDLLNFDLRTFDVRNVPVTEGLRQQRKLSLPVPEAWWVDCLHRGYVFRSKLGLEDQLGEWLEEASTELLFASYADFAERVRDRRPLSREAFGTFMRRMRTIPQRLRNCIVGEHVTDVNNPFGGISRKAEVIRHPRKPGFRLGTLEVARAGFIAATNLPVEWESESAEP